MLACNLLMIGARADCGRFTNYLATRPALA